MCITFLGVTKSLSAWSSWPQLRITGAALVSTPQAKPFLIKGVDTLALGNKKGNKSNNVLKLNLQVQDLQVQNGPEVTLYITFLTL